MSRKAFLAIAIVALAALTTSCEINLNRTRSHQRITRTYTGSAVKPFERIAIDALCDVTYRQADSTSIVITYPDQRTMDNTVVKNKDGLLSIGFKTSHKVTRLSDDEALIVEVCSPDLIEVDMRGAGVFRAETPIDTDTLLLQLKGAGMVDISQLVCDRLQADLRGAGKVALGQVTAQESRLNLRGVGKVTANFQDGGRLDCQLTGVGKMTLLGSVSHFNRSVMGTGRIDDSKLEVRSEK